MNMNMNLNPSNFYNINTPKHNNISPIYPTNLLNVGCKPNVYFTSQNNAQRSRNLEQINQPAANINLKAYEPNNLTNFGVTNTITRKSS